MGAGGLSHEGYEQPGPPNHPAASSACEWHVHTNPRRRVQDPPPPPPSPRCRWYCLQPGPPGAERSKSRNGKPRAVAAVGLPFAGTVAMSVLDQEVGGPHVGLSKRWLYMQLHAMGKATCIK